MKRRIALLVSMAALLGGLTTTALTGCRSHRLTPPADRMPAVTKNPASAENMQTVLSEDLARLKAAPATISILGENLLNLQKDWQTVLEPMTKRKYRDITSEETDRIERLLFQFLMYRESLWDMIAFFSDFQTHFATEADQTRSFATAFHAAALLTRHTAWLVSYCLDEAVLVKKLNEAHYRYDIPDGTFAMLFYSLTAPRHLEDLNSAREFFAAEATKLDSCLNTIIQEDPAFARSLTDTAWLWMQADQLTRDILRRKAIALPAVANLLRQNELTEQSRKVTKLIANNLYVAQGLLFNTVSDFKRPATAHIVFSADQTKQVKDLLQPGDVIFTYSAGYMSNVFLPGKFKHGITYVGSPAQREALGLATAPIEAPESKRVKYAADLGIGALATGEEADVIEAVAEGVIFNSVELLMHNHINRMAVLRPRLTEAERRLAVGNAFLLLGCPYDFNFDFVDVTYQCCTEVIYRSLYKRGGMEFELISRAGVQTLAADDIVQYHLSCAKPVFEFVLFAEEDPASKGHEARILTGEEGSQRLAALMTEKAAPTLGFTFPKLPLPGKK